LKFLSVTKVEEVTTDQQLNFSAVVSDSKRSGFYLVSYDRVIYETRDFKTFNHIAGSHSQNGYRSGDSPIYGTITALLRMTFPPASILAVDTTHHCVRILISFRRGYEDNRFVGKCGTRGYEDGNVRYAKLSDPYDIIQVARNNYLILEKYKLRRFWLNKSEWKVQTVRSLNQEASRFTAHPTTKIIYIAFKSGLGIFEENKLTLLATNLGVGHDDGILSNARIKGFQELVFLNGELLLLTDKDNGVLRLVNLANNTISTICSPLPYDQPESTSVTQCRLTNPHLLQVDETNKIVYVLGADGINKLKYVCK